MEKNSKTVNFDKENKKLVHLIEINILRISMCWGHSKEQNRSPSPGSMCHWSCGLKWDQEMRWVSPTGPFGSVLRMAGRVLSRGMT